MTPRSRNLANRGLLPLIMVILCGCCSTDRQLRADVRQWITEPPPHGSADYTKKFEELNARYGDRLVPAALHEAANATSPEGRKRLVGLVVVAFAWSERPSAEVYRACLTAVADANRFRSYVALRALTGWTWSYRVERDSADRMARDFEALTRSAQPWTRAYGYALLREWKHGEEHVAELLARAANEDRSFAVRYAAVVTLHALKEAEPEAIKYYLGLFETIGKQDPPFLPRGTVPSRDALVKRLARILRSDQHQKVEGLYALTFPYEADQVDLKLYAVDVARSWDLQELIPEIKPLVKATDPILRQGAESVLEAFEWRKKNR